MELTDLLTFSAVARTGGITRAAEELNTVQSNVTQRVKALEAEIGAALFERHSRGMTLTGAGRRLLPYAQRMAALSREAMLAARDDGEPKGPLADRIDGDDGRGAPACPARRFPSPLSRRCGSACARRRPPISSPACSTAALDGAFVAGPDRTCRPHLDRRVPRRAGAGHGAAR